VYAGHFACGVALWAVRLRTPAWVPLVGIGVLDLLNGAGVAAGIERISPAPGEVLGISLDYIDWDHSLVMALVWSLAYAALVGWRHGRDVALIGGLAVFSHFVADVLMHNGDMALWPGSDVRLGLWLWHFLPVGSWFIEGAFAAALVAFAIGVGRRHGIPARAWRRSLVVLAVLHVSFFPALSPMKLAGANLAGTELAAAYAVLVIVGFAVPAWLLSRTLPVAETSR
jgi:membrane-bound metal-dependent hydrolase YbcI (DUF457 family)